MTTPAPSSTTYPAQPYNTTASLDQSDRQKHGACANVLAVSCEVFTAIVLVLFLLVFLPLLFLNAYFWGWFFWWLLFFPLLILLCIPSAYAYERYRVQQAYITSDGNTMLPVTIVSDVEQGTSTIYPQPPLYPNPPSPPHAASYANPPAPQSNAYTAPAYPSQQGQFGYSYAQPPHTVSQYVQPTTATPVTGNTNVTGLSRAQTIAHPPTSQTLPQPITPPQTNQFLTTTAQQEPPRQSFYDEMKSELDKIK